jgi:hypothetical protein
MKLVCCQCKVTECLCVSVRRRPVGRYAVREYVEAHSDKLAKIFEQPSACAEQLPKVRRTAVVLLCSIANCLPKFNNVLWHLQVVVIDTNDREEAMAIWNKIKNTTTTIDGLQQWTTSTTVPDTTTGKLSILSGQHSTSGMVKAALQFATKQRETYGDSWQEHCKTAWDLLSKVSVTVYYNLTDAELQMVGAVSCFVSFPHPSTHRVFFLVCSSVALATASAQ